MTSHEIASADALLAENAELSRRLCEMYTTIREQDALLSQLRTALEGTTRAMEDRCTNHSRAWRWAREVVAANRAVLEATRKERAAEVGDDRTRHTA